MKLVHQLNLQYKVEAWNLLKMKKYLEYFLKANKDMVNYVSEESAKVEKMEEDDSSSDDSEERHRGTASLLFGNPSAKKIKKSDVFSSKDSSQVSSAKNLSSWKS